MKRWHIAVGLLLSVGAFSGAAADLYALSAFYRVLHTSPPAPRDLLPWTIWPSLAGLCTIVPIVLAASVPLVWFTGATTARRQFVALVYAVAAFVVLWYQFAFIRHSAWQVICRGCSGPAL